WIERCLAGSEPIPESLKIQMACCTPGVGRSIKMQEFHIAVG
ncbi:DNA-binding protein YbiB, partial [Escherichia coli]